MRRRHLVRTVAVVALVTVALVWPVFVHFRFRSAIEESTTAAAAPTAFEGEDPTGRLQAEGRLGSGQIIDHLLVADQGLIVLIRETGHRRWVISTVDARTGDERWRYGRDNVNHIESWTMTDGVVVACFHRSSSRLAERIGRWTSVVAFDLVSGKVLWKRSDLFMPPKGTPGHYDSDLARGKVVYGRDRQGRWHPVTALTGSTDVDAPHSPPGR